MRLLDVCLAISVAVIWGGGFLFAKVAIEHFPPILLMAFRFGLTAVLLVWFVPKPSNNNLRRIFWVALISAAVQYSLTFTGLKGLDASTAIIVVQLEVPFGVLMAVIFLKDRLTLQQIFGMCLAFAGVALIAGEPTLRDDLLPVFLVVGGAFTWAMGQVLIKTLDAISGFNLIAWVAVFATPQLLLSSWLFERDQYQAIVEATPIVWTAVVYLALVMTALGYTIWYHLLGRYTVNQVMPFLLLLPVTTVIGGVLLLGETLTQKILLGGILAIVGVAVINMRRTNTVPARLEQ